jgi:hypothetical protein
MIVELVVTEIPSYSVFFTKRLALLHSYQSKTLYIPGTGGLCGE